MVSWPLSSFPLSSLRPSLISPSKKEEKKNSASPSPPLSVEETPAPSTRGTQGPSPMGEVERGRRRPAGWGMRRRRSWRAAMPTATATMTAAVLSFVLFAAAGFIPRAEVRLQGIRHFFLPGARHHTFSFMPNATRRAPSSPEADAHRLSISTLLSKKKKKAVSLSLPQLSRTPVT